MCEDLLVFNSEEYAIKYAVLLDDIYPLHIANHTFVNFFYIEEKISDKRPDYVVGTLIMIDNRPFFRLEHTDKLILLASDSAIFDVEKFHSGGQFYYSDFDAQYGEIKITNRNFAFKIDGYYNEYPINYVTSNENMNLILNNPLCVKINSLKTLDTLEDDGIWVQMFYEEFKDSYSRELFKKKLFAQKELIGNYSEIYSNGKSLCNQDTKEKRKQLIRQLFGKDVGQ